MSYDSETSSNPSPSVSNAELIDRTREFAFSHIGKGSPLSREEIGMFLLDVVELGDRLQAASKN